MALPALVGAHRGRPGPDALEPALQMREVLELLALPFVRHDPRVAGDVGDGVVAPAMNSRVRQALVEDPVQTVGLIDVARDRVRQLLGCVADEVMVLTGHRTQARHLPEQPLQHLVAPAQVRGQQLARSSPRDTTGSRRTRTPTRAHRRPRAAVSTIAGMRLLGAMARKAGSNCAPVPMLTGTMR